MKLKLLLICMLISFSVTKVEAKGVILYSMGETIEKVIDLPKKDEYTILAQDGKLYYTDLGIMHNQFSIFWIPLWNYGTAKYVLYTDTKIGKYDYTYADLSNDDIAYLQNQYRSIPDTPQLSFWSVIGGKIVAFLIIQLLFFRKWD